jgi:hypothetical protein
LSNPLYRPQEFVDWLLPLLNKRGYGNRQASLLAKLDPSAVSRYLHGIRPTPEACLALGGLFGQENEALKAAQYNLRAPTQQEVLNELDPEAVTLARKIDARLKGSPSPEDRDRLYRLFEIVVESSR